MIRSRRKTKRKMVRIELEIGWNLISLPAYLDGRYINSVFVDANDGDEIWTQIGEQWVTTTYYGALPGWFGDLERIEAGRGYHYKATEAYTLVFESPMDWLFWLVLIAIGIIALYMIGGKKW